MVALDDKRYVDVGNGLKIGLEQSIWKVSAKNGCFDLIETVDFYRVVLLLERPYTEVKSLLDGFADSKGTDSDFPYWRVVGAGLASESDRWARLALDWLPQLPESDRARLRNLVLQVRDAKWASQKSKHLARRYSKEPNRGIGEFRGSD